MFHLEIDCAPFTKRPDEHLASILVKTQEDKNISNEIKELIVKKWDKVEPVSTLFGNYIWELESLEDKVKNDKIVNYVFSYIKDLYNSGAIRYGGICIK